MNGGFIIHLPTHAPRRRACTYIPLDQVREPHDLPPYLFMGRLDESTFTTGTKGWSATWRRTDDTWFRIDFDAADRRVDARDSWLARDGFYTCMHHTDLRALAQMRFMSPVAAWENQAEETLEARWNLKYLKAEDGDWLMAGLPDGLMKTLMLPIPVEALPRLVDTFIGFRDAPGMDFPVSGYVVPVMGAVNYLEGPNPDWAMDPGDRATCICARFWKQASRRPPCRCASKAATGRPPGRSGASCPWPSSGCRSLG